jgi:hypothetical protein
MYVSVVYHLALVFTVKADKVINPYGSTAGAGSGDFHVYRHARSREMARWKALDEEEEEQALENKFEQELKACTNEQERKTARNRRKRQREKTAKLRKKNLKAAGIEIEIDNASSSAQQDAQLKDAGEEFTYTSTPAGGEQEEEKQEEKPLAAKRFEPVVEEIPNDGSFLELMTKRLAEEESQKQGQPKRENSDDEEGPAPQPPAKKRAITTQIFDIDDE